VAETTLTDSDAISASLRDPAQFGIIFARHHAAIFRFAARRVGVQDAGGIASEVFLRAFRIRHRYDTSRANCLPWLYGIAGNLVGDQLRRMKRRQRLYLVAHSEPSRLDPLVDADNRAVADSVAGRLNGALRRLSARDRDTLLLYALEGLSYSEISHALGVPIGTVGSRISRARKRIRDAIPDLEQITDKVAPRKDKALDDD
jgi:RNA polymerase sigma-70 factor, ECF subfamily